MPDKCLGHLAAGTSQKALHRASRHPHADACIYLVFAFSITQMHGLQFVMGKVNYTRLLQRLASRLENRRVNRTQWTGTCSGFARSRHY